MRKILLYIFISLVFLGCGGGGAGGDEGSIPASIPGDNISGTSYPTTDYIVPGLSSNSISSRSIQTNSYGANYRALDSDTIVETPDDAPDETIIYQKLSNKIHITIKKSDSIVSEYDMKKEIHIGESITVNESACILVQFYTQKYLNGQTFYDVLEIDCGKHKGYYAKNQGFVGSE